MRNNQGNRQGRRNRRPGGSRGGGGSSQSAKPKKLSLFQRIIALFTGGSKPAPSNGHKRGNDTNGGRSGRSSDRYSDRSESRAESRGESRGENRREHTSRKPPETTEVTTPRLYVGNLSYDATESDLFELFNGVGKVANAEVVANRRTMKSKGFAFVQMQTIDEAKRAVEVLHDKDFMGRKLVVNGAKNPIDHSGDN